MKDGYMIDVLKIDLSSKIGDQDNVHFPIKAVRFSGTDICSEGLDNHIRYSD